MADFHRWGETLLATQILFLCAQENFSGPESAHSQYSANRAALTSCPPNLNPLILSLSKDPRFDQRGHDPRYRHHKRKKSWLEEIFD